MILSVAMIVANVALFQFRLVIVPLVAVRLVQLMLAPESLVALTVPFTITHEFDSIPHLVYIQFVTLFVSLSARPSDTAISLTYTH